MEALDFEFIAESIPHVVWVAELDGSITYVNARGVEAAGRSIEELQGWGWLSALHPDDVDRARRAWETAVADRGSYDVEYRVRGHDGEYRWFVARALLPANPGGTMQRWVGTWTDIDARKRLEESLRASERTASQSLSLLEALQATAPIALGLVDRDFRIVQANQVLVEQNRAAGQPFIGRRVDEVIPHVWSQVKSNFERVLATGQAIMNIDAEGSFPDSTEPRHWTVSYFPVRIGDEIIGVGLVGVDVTDRRRNEEFRAFVMDNMAEGLCALDRDGRVTFINAVGARMLGWSADELQGMPMHETTHFQRADGSPLPEAECEIAKVWSQGRTVRVADDVFSRRDGTVFPVTYSAGPLRSGETIHGAIAVFHDTSEEKAEELLRQRELDALAWVGRIREALDENRFVLYSQPIIPLAGGIPAEELLLRMVGRDGSVIAPGFFLPVAEQYGLIVEIDTWVITEAVRLAAHGRRVELNVSADTIGKVDLLALVERELERRHVDPSLLVFELTETALMTDVDSGETFARGLERLGCGLALDDFGTGFGSFTYLKRLPINFLKIDIDFVHDLASNTANQHLVKAIVSLARAFGQQTIAEGVDDAQTLGLLREYGVDFAQGFHLGRPAPVPELA